MIQTFKYENSPIQFEVIDGMVMANATAMFKANNSRLDHWKSAEGTKRYIEAVTRNQGIAESQLVISKYGGSGSQGTWIHEKLILNAARYISVEFELWCDEIISELLRNGTVSLRPSELSRMELLKMALQAEEERIQLSEAVAIMAPKVEYVDKVLASTSTFTVTQIANELNLSAQELNSILVDRNVQHFSSGEYALYQDLKKYGYTETRTVPYKDRLGRSRTKHYMVWTERGRLFIHYLINDNLSWSKANKKLLGSANVGT